jgi:hypothetical protein
MVLGLQVFDHLRGWQALEAPESEELAASAW